MYMAHTGNLFSNVFTFWGIKKKILLVYTFFSLQVLSGQLSTREFPTKLPSCALSCFCDLYATVKYNFCYTILEKRHFRIQSSDKLLVSHRDSKCMQSLQSLQLSKIIGSHLKISSTGYKIKLPTNKKKLCNIIYFTIITIFNRCLEVVSIYTQKIDIRVDIQLYRIKVFCRTVTALVRI